MSIPTLPLSKVMDLPADYEALAPELELVHRVGVEGQADQRRWEYAMALRAIQTKREISPSTAVCRILDVGGAGSPFALITAQLPGRTQCEIVDPRVNTPLEAYVGEGPVEAICCISVLEHLTIGATPPFLQHVYDHLRPYGLAFFTFDYKVVEGPDTYHFRWMRERIFTPSTRASLLEVCRAIGFRPFGGYSVEGVAQDQVYDYNFASLALMKFPQGVR